MLNFQPDIVQQQILVRVAELQLLIARNQLLPQLSLNALYQLNGLGQQLDSAEAVMTGATLKALNPVIANKQRAAGLDSQPGNLQQLRHLAGRLHVPDAPGHAVAAGQYAAGTIRSCCEHVPICSRSSTRRPTRSLGSSWKSTPTTSSSRRRRGCGPPPPSGSMLSAAYYEEGRITIDRFLDAVSQYATAVATEAQYKTTYNISIVALEEAKGTLLAYDNIAVAEGPYPRKAYIQARDIQGAHRQFPIPPDGPQVPERTVGPLRIPIRPIPSRRRVCDVPSSAASAGAGRPAADRPPRPLPPRSPARPAADPLAEPIPARHRVASRGTSRRSRREPDLGRRCPMGHRCRRLPADRSPAPRMTARPRARHRVVDCRSSTRSPRRRGGDGNAGARERSLRPRRHRVPRHPRTSTGTIPG